MLLGVMMMDAWLLMYGEYGLMEVREDRRKTDFLAARGQVT